MTGRVGATAIAQELRFEFRGTGVHKTLGNEVAAAGDVDADGTVDLLVAAFHAH